MTWKEQTVARIPLLVARMLAGADLGDELKRLSTSIQARPARGDA